MSDEKKWSEISNEISKVAKNIIDQINEEDFGKDLKYTFKSTIENFSELIKNIIQNVETTITDEEIKKEIRDIFYKINLDLKNLIIDTKEKFSESLSINSRLEEE